MVNIQKNWKGPSSNEDGLWTLLQNHGQIQRTHWKGVETLVDEYEIYGLIGQTEFLHYFVRFAYIIPPNGPSEDLVFGTPFW